MRAHHLYEFFLLLRARAVLKAAMPADQLLVS